MIGARLISPVGRLLSGACQLLEGGRRAAPQLEALIRKAAPQNLLGLRRCASDILVAYEVSSCTPDPSVLEAIVAAVVALPKFSPKAPHGMGNGSALDRGTLTLLRRAGVSGLAFRQTGRVRRVQPRDSSRLIEWAATARPLAIPSMSSFERDTLTRRRVQLLDAVALALLDSNAVLAAAGLRWLAVLPTSTDDTRLISAGILRAAQLGADDPQARFDCCLAARFLENRSR